MLQDRFDPDCQDDKPHEECGVFGIWNNTGRHRR